MWQLDALHVQYQVINLLPNTLDFQQFPTLHWMQTLQGQLQLVHPYSEY